MVAIHEQVNDKSSYLRTFSDRLAEERKRLGLSQADFGRLAGVGRTTQNKYESGEGEPGAYYIARIEGMDVDVMYLLTGLRGADALSDELQNLVGAYVDADESTQLAVFGVLTARFSDDVRRAQKVPGWHQHELVGEEDVRYQNPPIPARVLMEPTMPGGIDEPRRAGAQKRDED